MMEDSSILVAGTVEGEAQELEAVEEPETIKVTSDLGFECEIEKDALQDVEMFENLVRLEKGDFTTISAIVLSLLGEEQKDALFDFIKERKKRVLFSVLSSELTSIFNNANESLKNS